MAGTEERERGFLSPGGCRAWHWVGKAPHAPFWGVTANPRWDFHKTNEVFTPQPCSCLYRLAASVGLSWNSCLAAAAGFVKAVRG